MTTSEQAARGKRSNNEGTSPRLRKDGTYQANYVAGYQPSGKPIRKSVYGATKAACAAKLKIALQHVSGGTASLAKSPRLIEWLDHYLDVVAPNGDVQPRTINAYRSKIDNYVRTQGISGKRLDKLTPTDIDALYADARNSRQRHRAGQPAAEPLAPSIIQGLHRVLRRALNVAVNRGVLARNPVLRVEVSAKTVFEPQVYTTEEIRTMLAVALDMDDGARWVLNLMLGLRQGEALGLAWSDIDFETSRIKISRELYTLPWNHGCTQQGSGVPSCGFNAAWRCPERHSGGYFTGGRPRARPATVACPCRRSWPGR
ncbi:hypothetical protein GT020_01865 [Glutamicibacter soli]|uniref:Core-binding (CB) domain-containing protein n=1 Tax=Glutamicibacter soli TaxID=453836 RepID=A0A6L9G1N1_9MICC|nr:site-specific integrase [Glutamicibacter soli]NAZ14817.1 hypothetical protein [Glutamicibacter soli]